MPVRKILPKTPLSLQSTVRVTDFSDVYVKKAVQDLLDTLAHHQLELDQKYPGKGMGVGLAANQIEYPPTDYPSAFIPPNIYVIYMSFLLEKKERALKVVLLWSHLFISTHLLRQYSVQILNPIKYLMRRDVFPFLG
jgi:hypothetical protein